jgi:hypothetical protein
MGGQEKLSIAREQPVNTFPQQPKHASASTICGPSLGNSPLNMSLSNRGILGSTVFCAVHAEVM